MAGFRSQLASLASSISRAAVCCSTPVDDIASDGRHPRQPESRPPVPGPSTIPMQVLRPNSGSPMREKLHGLYLRTQSYQYQLRQLRLAGRSSQKFFEEASALLDSSTGEQYRSTLAEDFYEAFQSKAIEFATALRNGTIAKTDCHIPITTFRKFMWLFQPNTLRTRDAMLRDLINAYPEFDRTVPKRAFCIWEGKEISQEHLSNLAEFLRLNPDYTLTLLTSKPKSVFNALAKREDGSWLMKKLIVKSQDYSGSPLVESAINRENNGPLANYASGSDIARMYALVKEDEKGESGGLYFDVDCKFNEPLPSSLSAPFGLQVAWKDGVFYNGIIAAAPASELLQEAIQTIAQQYDQRRKSELSEDLWCNKRVLPIALEANEASTSRAGTDKADDESKMTSAELKGKGKAEDVGLRNNFIGVNFSGPSAQNKSQFKQLLDSERRKLTSDATVRPLHKALSDNFGVWWERWSSNLCGLTELVIKNGSKDKEAIELSVDLEWAAPRPKAKMRHASIS